MYNANSQKITVSLPGIPIRVSVFAPLRSRSLGRIGLPTATMMTERRVLTITTVAVDTMVIFIRFRAQQLHSTRSSLPPISIKQGGHKNTRTSAFGGMTPRKEKKMVYSFWKPIYNHGNQFSFGSQFWIWKPVWGFHIQYNFQNWKINFSTYDLFLIVLQVFN